jgi:hypothetical protein
MAQTGWRWCDNCQGLFFGGGSSQGVCPAGGGAHDSSQSGDYSLNFDTDQQMALGAQNTTAASTLITSTENTGLQAFTEANGFSGLAGIDQSASGGYGTSGWSTNGSGVYGQTTGPGTAPTTPPVLDPTSPAGLRGSSAGSYTAGVWGESAGSYGVGVYGVCTAVPSGGQPGIGVCGVSYSDYRGGGFGVYGQGTQSGGCFVAVPPSGVPGHGLTAGCEGEVDVLCAGMYAFCDQPGNAVVAEGDCQVSGNLSKAGGSFKIDHPLDPANKYLSHSFVESPDMKNIYDGVVVLDAQGSATVALPAWFESLNRDFRYQLTPIGQPAPDLHIASEVSGGRFSIAGGHEGQKVSWTVTGIRQDHWANAHRIAVEEDKPPEDRGRYLHPELFGAGAEPITLLATARNQSAWTGASLGHPRRPVDQLGE